MKKRLAKKLSTPQAEEDVQPIHLLALDLEATCWQGEAPGPCEIIEIGAVLLDLNGNAPEREFAAFVRPIQQPLLSDFCVSLTGISQQEVDSAQPFEQVIARLTDWLGEVRVIVCSWGLFDRNQLRRECRQCGMQPPISLRDHIELRRTWAKWRRQPPHSLHRALEASGLTPEAPAHRALSDARNLARLSRIVFQDRALAPKR